MKIITFVASITALSLNLGLHAEEQMKLNNDDSYVAMENNQDEIVIDEYVDEYPYNYDEPEEYSDDDSINYEYIEEDEDSLDNDDKDSTKPVK